MTPYEAESEGSTLYPDKINKIVATKGGRRVPGGGPALICDGG